jgi:hypothetical protein
MYSLQQKAVKAATGVLKVRAFSVFFILSSISAAFYRSFILATSGNLRRTCLETQEQWFIHQQF